MVMIDFIRVTTLRIPLMTHLHEYKMATKAYITKKKKNNALFNIRQILNLLEHDIQRLHAKFGKNYFINDIVM